MSNHASIFIDESTVELGGVQHLLLAAVSFNDPATPAYELSKLKREFGISPFTEVKYSQRSSPLKEPENRYRYSQEVLDIVREHAQFACFAIFADFDKQVAAQRFLKQIVEVLREQTVGFSELKPYEAYACYYDENLAGDLGELWYDAE